MSALVGSGWSAIESRSSSSTAMEKPAVSSAGAWSPRGVSVEDPERTHELSMADEGRTLAYIASFARSPTTCA